MNIKSYLIEEYKKLNISNEQIDFINDVLSFVSEVNAINVNDIKKIEEKNIALDNKVSKAQTLINDAKEEILKEKTATVTALKKKLQPARDRVMSLESTTDYLKEQLDNHSINSDEIGNTINNLFANTSLIYKELNKLDLWDDCDDKPKDACEPMKKKKKESSFGR